MEREIIIVGAGPAGAAAAADLAQRGHDVLLLDRKDFPRDKACGDAVPASAIAILYELGMKEAVLAAQERGEFYPLHSMRLVSPNGHIMEADFHPGRLDALSYVAPRLYFDAVVQQGAAASGAEFLQAHVTEPIVEEGRVVGVRARANGGLKEFRGRLVIGADGVTSVIARNLRPKEQQHVDGHRAVALRAYLDDLDEFPYQVEFYLDKNILPGYAWIFPTGESQANIGLGMRLDYFRQKNRSLGDMLEQFLDLPEIKKRLKRGGEVRDVATWQLNFGSQKHMQHAFDGALLIGDAAGFINPLTGGGIHNAIISARLAAKRAHEALTAGDVSQRALHVYEEDCHQEMWSAMRRSFFFQRTLAAAPFISDFLIKYIGADSSLSKMFLTKL